MRPMVVDVWVNRNKNLWGKLPPLLPPLGTHVEQLLIGRANIMAFVLNQMRRR